MAQIASSLKGTYFEILADIFKAEIDSIDTMLFLFYMSDVCDEKALYILAEQYDVLGYKGMDLCTTIEQKRELIKAAIELHKYKGTNYSIRKAMQSIGLNDLQIIEPDNGFLLCDGSVFCNGDYYCSGSKIAYGIDWATFSLIFDIGNDLALSEETIFKMVQMVNEYKPARSVVVGTEFESTITDTVNEQSDSMEIDLHTDDYPDSGPHFNDTISDHVQLCDGTIYCDGSVLCNGLSNYRDLIVRLMVTVADGTYYFVNV